MLANEPVDDLLSPADSLDYWRQRKAAGLARANLLPLAAELGAGINWLTITAILLIGEPFEGLSPFNGISLRAFSEDVLSAPREPQRYRRIEDLYERLDEIVRGAIRLIPEDMPAVIGLSGGRDSRHILFAHLAEGRPLPRLVTARHFINGLSERDLAAAQMVAARLGAPHTVVDQPGDRFRPEWDKNLMIGLQNLQHSWGIALARELAGPEALYDGLSGGILFGRGRSVASFPGRAEPRRPPFADMRAHLLKMLVDRPLELLRPWAPPHLISPEVLQTIRDMLLTSFSRYEQFPNPLSLFSYDQLTRRITPHFTFGMMPNEVVVCPYDTREMLHFAFSLPWEVSCDWRFQDKALAHCYPQYADLPFGSDLETPPPAWTPDEQSEAASWGRLRPLLAPRLSPAGLEYLDKSPRSLRTVQSATLLAQAYFWDEHGYLPDAATFFGPEGA
ncbi:MAG: hypothetical protein IT316_08010 [Anaerolineales bacterium]|nr:hypothetical protein [Anaerolineales bacterium]